LKALKALKALKVELQGSSQAATPPVVALNHLSPAQVVSSELYFLARHIHLPELPSGLIADAVAPASTHMH